MLSPRGPFIAVCGAAGLAVLIFVFGCGNRSELELARRNAAQSRLYYQHAVERYKRVIAAAADKDQAIFELGRLYYDHGDFRLAGNELERTRSRGAAKFLALAYFHLGDYSGAYDILSKNKFSDEESAYYHGRAAEKLNLFDEAVRVYRGISGSIYKKEAQSRIRAIRKDGAAKIAELDPRINSILAKAPGPDEYPQAGALILSCDESIEVKSDGTQVAEVYYLVKILNERGKEDYAEAKIDYDSTFEKVELEYARTIKPDGSVAEAGRGNIRDVSKYMNFPLYSNARLYIISFPEVSQGAALEYKLKIHNSSLINKKDFILSYPVQAREPIISANFSLTLPKELPLHYKVINREYNDFSAQLDPQKEELSEALVYRWSFRNVPAILPESNMPPDTQVNPAILMSTFNDWQEVYDWWRDLSHSAIKAGEPIKNKVRELVRDKKTEEERLKVIHDFCAKNIRYVAVEYGQAGYKPHQAEDIFRNKYGDCKDQAVLLVTMLKEAGIPAYLVLISTYDYYDLLPELPSALFNHAIAVARIADKDIFLDPTASTCSVADLPPADQERQVLVFMDEGYRIEKTPLYGADHNTVRQTTDISIYPEDGITAKRTVIPGGFYNQAQRYWLLYTQPELVRQALKEKIQGISIGSTLDDYSVTGLENLDEPVVLSYNFHGPEYFTAAGPLRIMPALASLDTSLAATDKRRYPLELVAPDKKETIFEITIPDNYDIKYLPENVSRDSPWFGFEAVYAHTTNKITFIQTAISKKRQISRTEYMDFKKFHDALARDIKQNIILERK